MNDRRMPLRAVALLGVAAASLGVATVLADPPKEDRARRSWPSAPDQIESLLRYRIDQHAGFIVDTINEVACTPTRCEVRFTSRELDSVTAPELIALLSALRQPPVSAPAVGMLQYEVAPGVREFVLVLHSAGGPTDDPYDIELSESGLLAMRDAAAEGVDEALHGEPPVTLGAYQGVLVVVEYVCSYDCPADTQQVIRFEVPEGRSCDDIGGMQRALTVPSELGPLERRVCMPSVLVD